MMRKHKEIVPKSPRPKIKLKSPQFKGRLKIKSPQHQVPQAGFQKSKPTFISHKQICFIPEQSIFYAISSLAHSVPFHYEFIYELDKHQLDTKIQVISSIDKFSQAFLLLQQNGNQCRKWIIISSAMNYKESEKNFNELYQPISFVFLSNISEVLNHFLHKDGTQQKIAIERIYSFGSACDSNNFVCIQDTKNKELVGIESHNIYVVDNKQDLNTFFQKIHCKLNVYFVEGHQYFDKPQDNAGKPCIFIKKMMIKKQKAIIMCLRNQVNFTQMYGLQYLQDYFKQGILQQTIKLNISNQNYCLKVINSVVKAHNKICIFYEQTTHQIAQITINKLKKYLDFDALWFPSSIYVDGPNFYKLKWDKKTRSANQFTLTDSESYALCQKMETFVKQKQNLKTKYLQKLKVLKNMNVKIYLKENPQHLIQKILKQIGIKVHTISGLQKMFETHKITMIIGYFTFSEIESLNTFHNVFVVPICKQSEEGAAISQIEEANQFLCTSCKIYEQIYNENGKQANEGFVHILYNRRQQIQILIKCLKIPQRLLKTQFIGHFELSLQDLQQYSRHLIIVDMGDFCEEIEKQIKGVQWKNNTMNIQVYVKYGNQFIQHTKDGNYKFIKPMQIQTKIDEIEELGSNPEPQPKVPQPFTQFTLQNDLLGDQKEKDSKIQIYKLYIFIHRSVPYHNLIRGHHKDCHILLYSRIEEVMIFSRYIKNEQKITLIANEQSKTLYDQVFSKEKISKQKLSFVFLKDMSENSIRKQINVILSAQNLGDLLQEETVKKFKALVIYQSSNQKMTKLIKLVRKIFASQLKILFIDEKDFNALQQNQRQFSINGQFKIYKMGLIKTQNTYKHLNNIKSIFILAMHPCLKQFDFNHNNIQYCLKNYVGRIIYGGQHKNYNTVVKKPKEIFRQTFYANKHAKTNSRQNFFSRMKTETCIGAIEPIERKRRISSKSSDLTVKIDSRYSVIVSVRLEKYCHSKTTFNCEDSLCSQILLSQSLSKICILVISEEQFQYFDIFSQFDYRKRDIFCIVQTHCEGKQAFSSSNVIFSLKQHILQAVNTLIKNYLVFIQFDGIQIVSTVPTIADKTIVGLGNKVSNKPFKLKVDQIENDRIQICLLGHEKQQIGGTEIIKFRNIQRTNHFLTFFIQGFRGSTNGDSFHHFGTTIYCPQKDVVRVRRALEHCGKKVGSIRGYDPQKIFTLIGYSLQKVLILLDKENRNNILWKLPFSLGSEENEKKLSELLSITLI